MTGYELHKQNRERAKDLTGKHRDFYNELNVYINAGDADERAAQEMFSEILDHLFEAQKEGKSPQALYGKSPKEYAAELAAQLPKQTMKTQVLSFTYLSFFAAGVLLAFDGVMKLFLPNTFNTTFLLFVPVLLVGGFVTLLTLRLMKYSAFTRFKIPWLAMIPQAAYMILLIWLLLEYRDLFAYDPPWYIYLVTAAACAGAGLAAKARMPY
ncbi:DUF1129 family protein [Alteribacter natronophilus]|uniref:DUF1129 family protein n=1 Tax=Alteribacter natronophilus TaxID=2583810 RepID=UPI00110D5DDB|nr:DUF1129 family protein [Alteribacter natronophilus]TMW73067.1 DUF1129 domain-containing protein [Alteribacter natronophilus]